jgi:hypothetical protein
MGQNQKGRRQHDGDDDDEGKEPERRKPRVKITPFGPDQATLDAAAHAALEDPAVEKLLKGTRHRLLSFRLVDPETRGKPGTALSNLYLATVFDYTNNRAILVKGRLDKRQVLEVEESNRQPDPDHAEFNEAVEILLRDPELGPSIREKKLEPYPAMPPIIVEERPDGVVERTLAVGLLPTDEEHRHEIVGVNMISQSVIRYEGGAPPGSGANDQTCGPLQGSNPASGTAGQVHVTISLGSTVFWRFDVVRPAASTGSRGSGVELRFVNYRGKRVLYRAHAPILNVKYDPGGLCNEFRDGANVEHTFQATGTDAAPGFRLCPTPAQTILDTGSDAGNFNGVAIYIQGPEVVLVSELQYGWYRYISEWRFHLDGTIRPRFGFGAISNSCVCNRHHHHVYWRLDFDIRTPGNNVVREYNNPPIIGNSHYHTKFFEIRRLKDVSHQRRWQIENADTGEGYTLIPGPNDGIADAAFGVGDLWVLRYHSDELDDHPGPNVANLDQFITGEPVYKQDVVLWYGAHFTHDVQNEGANHVVGPDLRPFDWE